MNSKEGPVPVSFEVARAIVKRTFVDPEPQHPVVAETYKEVSTKKDNIVSNRRDVCLVAQLRLGHCKQLAHYANRIDEKTSPTCSKCEEEPETVGHWLKCPATVMKRQQHFGRDNVDLGILSRDPEISSVCQSNLALRRAPQQNMTMRSFPENTALYYSAAIF